jgi:class III poly(R)-hydroxyalkanoic acid synthase PhaE subunit
MSIPKAEDISTITDIVTVWIKNTNAMWETMAKAYPKDNNETDTNTGNDPPNRLKDKFAANFRLWKATAKTMEEPETVEAFFKGLQTIPDTSTRLLHNSIESVTKLQDRWLKHIEKNRNSAGAYHFDDPDSEFLNQWTDLYKEEIQRFLNIPQLGLTKFYQEKLNQTVDKTNLFQTAIVEFLRLLFIPLEKSITTLQEKLSDLVSEGKLPDDNRDYYRLWIQILEGHYMSLFKSSDYTHAMSKTLETMNQFIYSRSQVLEDTLQTLPIPTNKDMDALYRDLYQLKRRVVSLEKQIQLLNTPTTTV